MTKKTKKKILHDTSAAILAVMLGLTVAACGTSRTERTLSGAGIGAGAGALAGAVTGGSGTTGAVIGGVIGGATGAMTDENDINLER